MTAVILPKLGSPVIEIWIISDGVWRYMLAQGWPWTRIYSTWVGWAFFSYILWFKLALSVLSIEDFLLQRRNGWTNVGVEGKF